MAQEFQYQWTDNPTISGISPCNTDILNDCLMHLMYDKKSGSGFNLFDTKLSDHILEGDEAQGWALQGTYVYKDAVAGSREGYPDFYAKCLEEYNEAQVGVFEQPILTENGVMGGNTFAVNASSVLDASVAAYKAFDAAGDSTYWHSAQGFPQWIAFYNPNPLKVTSLQVTNRKVDGAYPNAYILQASSDNTAWVDITSGNSTSGDSVTWEITIPSGTIAYKYWRIYVSSASGSNNNYVAIGNIKINAVEILKKHPNGHLFYDITDKESVDDLFTTTGMAWLYGVDTENERIFLPRNNYFDQATGDISEAGQSVEAGLPNITGQSPALRGCDYVAGGTGALYTTPVGNGAQAGVNTNVPVLNFDASRSNPIYSNSDTVQPNAVKKLLYICVGNTESTSAVTDVVEVTTTENDTTPNFASKYFGFKPNNISWLKAGQQANFASIYEFTYNELVNVLNGETKYGDLKVINESDMVSGVDYSLYWKVNQEALSFTCPIRTEERILVAKKEPTEADPTWYNLYSDGWLEQGGIDTSFTDHYVSLLKSFKTKDYDVKVQSQANAATNIGIFWAISDKSISQFKAVYYKGANSDNATNNGFSWQASGYTEIPTVSDYTENVNLYFKVANAVQNLELLDAGEVLEAVADKISRQDCKAYVTETYQNGTSWYRVYSDGWCEQGGGNITSSGNVNFLKPFIDTNYCLTGSIGYGTSSNTYEHFNMEKKSNSYFYQNCCFDGYRVVSWQASGYIA